MKAAKKNNKSINSHSSKPFFFKGKPDGFHLNSSEKSQPFFHQPFISPSLKNEKLDVKGDLSNKNILQAQCNNNICSNRSLAGNLPSTVNVKLYENRVQISSNWIDSFLGVIWFENLTKKVNKKNDKIINPGKKLDIEILKHNGRIKRKDASFSLQPTKRKGVMIDISKYKKADEIIIKVSEQGRPIRDVQLCLCP